MILELIKLHERQPILFNAILKGSSGIVGEYIVAQALEQRGFEVEVVGNNSRERDLLVDGHIVVEVKTVRGRNPWWVSRRPDNADFWVLVRMPKYEDAPIPTVEQVEFFIFTLPEVQEVWDAHPANHRPGSASDIRPQRVPDDAVNAFHKIGE